jgi:5-methylcytosine-specific restriction enzyme B
MPMWDEFMVPVLKSLADGAPASRKDIKDRAVELLHLSDEVLAEKVRSGESRAHDRAGWALTYLNRAGAVDRPQRGWHQITQAGRELLAARPARITEADLRAQPGWVDWPTGTRTGKATQEPTTKAGNRERIYRVRPPLPGTARRFTVWEFERASTEKGYVIDPLARTVHAGECRNSEIKERTPVDGTTVAQWWDGSTPIPEEMQWCPDCIKLPVASTRRDLTRAVSAAANALLDRLFGDPSSVIEPTRSIWTTEVAEDLRARIEDTPLLGSEPFMDKLHRQLDGASDDVVLLAAELVHLQQIALENLWPSFKQRKVEHVLSWAESDYVLPPEILDGLAMAGYIHGGASFNTRIWAHLTLLCQIIKAADALPDSERQEVRADPWAFRKFVFSVGSGDPAIRNLLLCLRFPDVFLPVVTDGDKTRIRDAFADAIDGPTGIDGESIDRDLARVRDTLEQEHGEPIHFYDPPWSQQWSRLPTTGDRAWAVRLKQGGQALLDRWVGEGFISLNASLLESVPVGATRPEVRDLVSAAYSHEPVAQQLSRATDVFEFCSRMQENDVVVVRHEGRAWLGRLGAGVALHDEEPRVRRDVAWLQDPIPEAELPHKAIRLLSDPVQNVVDLTPVREDLEALMPTEEGSTVADVEPLTPPDAELAPGKTVDEEDVPLLLRRADDALADALHTDKIWLDGFIDLLEARRQVIVHGPPGTGKTYTARAIAEHIAGDDGTVLVQFHPSYSYEDFFQGYRPAPREDGQLGFELRPGPLGWIASSAEQDSVRPYVLIIDEINRANLAKVFGELYFLLEYRDKAIRTQYSSDKSFSLPPNLFIIGTMNTADRSIAMVDAAIRRRFAFVEMHPDVEPVAGLLERWLDAEDADVDDDRAALLVALNSQIEDRDFKIGPSYLMLPEAATGAGLERIWRHDILPLLEEHYYGRLTRDQIEGRFGLEVLQRRMATAVVDARGDLDSPGGPPSLGS